MLTRAVGRCRSRAPRSRETPPSGGPSPRPARSVTGLPPASCRPVRFGAHFRVAQTSPGRPRERSTRADSVKETGNGLRPGSGRFTHCRCHRDGYTLTGRVIERSTGSGRWRVAGPVSFGPRSPGRSDHPTTARGLEPHRRQRSSSSSSSPTLFETGVHSCTPRVGWWGRVSVRRRGRGPRRRPHTHSRRPCSPACGGCAPFHHRCPGPEHVLTGC